AGQTATRRAAVTSTRVIIWVRPYPTVQTGFWGLLVLLSAGRSRSLTRLCRSAHQSWCTNHREPKGDMSGWQQWMRQPQRVWLRRALFQIHLWTGLVLGLYVVMLSVTGSALVYRNELDRFFATPRPTFDPNATRLMKEQLQATAERVYPGWDVTRVGDRITRRNPTIEVWVERGSEKKERLFNPYTGEDLGASVTQ